MITDQKPLVAIFKKDIASLSHRLQKNTIMNVSVQHKNAVQV